MADAGDKDSPPYQSLYRRFRPQRFDEVLGQEHVSLALRNAVRDGRVGHAYLFSGPRGTGKTSTARILAKALNCAALEDGEPCGRCDSCIEIARGASLDVHELDAASNNGVDAMRDLVAHAALGTPGRWKVYIVDEVHMLSTAASNALLKTLEEPPGHVVFVLATTDAQKVLPTIRSRTQHFEFRLLGSETLSALLHQVRSASGLAVPDEALDAAVRRGRGSARDALSALDQVAAGGVLDDDIEVLAELAESLAARDPARSLVAVAHACEAGRDPQRLAADLAEYLRQGFLAMVAGELVGLSGAERARVEDTARRMGLPALVRALEELGRAQVDMRDIPDQRVHLEVALIKLAHPQADDSTVALLERVERLERALADGAGAGAGGGAETTPARTLEVPSPPPGGPPPARARAAAAKETGPAPTADVSSESPRDATAAGDSDAGDADAEAEAAISPAGAGVGGGAGGPELARRTLGAVRRQSGSTRRPPRTGGSGDATPGPAPHAGAAPDAAVSGAVATLPSRDELVQVWGDGLLAGLPNRARARFRVGRFLDVDGGSAVFALPNETHRSYCEEVRLEVEAALGARFGTAVPIRLVVDDEAEEGTGTTPPARAPRSSPPVSVGAVRSPGAAGVEGSADVAVTTGVAGGAAVSGTAGAAGPAVVEEHESPDLLDPAVLAAETEPAGAGLTPQERLKQAFPGAQEV